MAKPGCTARYLTDLEDDGYVPCFKAKGHKGAHTSNRGHHWTDDHPRHVYATIVSGAPEKPVTGEMAEGLAQENESLREDIEDYQNRIEDLKDQVDRLTRNMYVADESVARDANRQAKANDLLHAENERITAELEKALLMIEAMKINGAQHWSQYGYQKHDGTQYVNYCKICDKPQDDPCHFQSEAKYLDSREVEKAVSTVQERLVRFLREGMGLRALPAAETVQGLLQGLPGIFPVQSVKRPPNLPGIGTRLRLKDVPANEARGPLTGVLESYTDKDGFLVRYDDETPIEYENEQITQFQILGRKQ